MPEQEPAIMNGYYHPLTFFGGFTTDLAGHRQAYLGGCFMYDENNGDILGGSITNPRGREEIKAGSFLQDKLIIKTEFRTVDGSVHVEYELTQDSEGKYKGVFSSPRFRGLVNNLSIGLINERAYIESIRLPLQRRHS